MDVLLLLRRRSVFVSVSVLLFWLCVITSHARSLPFSTDSIPVVDEEVTFTYRFEADIDKKEYLTRTYFFIDRELDPYKGAFLKHAEDTVVCRVTDYLDIESSMLYLFGVYMTYDLVFVYRDASCDLSINNIQFMEKGYYERQQESPRNLNLTMFTGKDILVDKRYTQLFKRGASDKIAAAAVARLNDVVVKLEAYFSN
ncbi:MAG: hypothetical protein QM237_05640 [Bacteroidota bacterium]|nr:hypothetical protein [Bacteroidota bacterium]HHU97173.1 hypothetical protein [Petrimonas sp.]